MSTLKETQEIMGRTYQDLEFLLSCLKNVLLRSDKPSLAKDIPWINESMNLKVESMTSIEGKYGFAAWDRHPTSEGHFLVIPYRHFANYFDINDEEREELWRLVAEGKKLLVFTEYRATQSYLKDSLQHRFFDTNEVLLINGSMNLDQKLATIEAFNEGPARFLISTEAGGEGLNLHRACHVMVNYDLPWNPARLVQRIGRLYRYGHNRWR